VDAIAEIEQNRSNLDDITTVPGLLQAFYAAQQLQDDSKAQGFARELVKLEPGLPSIQKHLP
jgi:hypothetical protein